MPRPPASLPLAATLALLAGFHARAHAQTLDDFENGRNPAGWQDAFGSAQIVAGGNPGDCLEVAAVSIPTWFGYTIYFALTPTSAGAPWIGDYAQAQVSELRVDTLHGYGITVVLEDASSGNSASYGAPAAAVGGQWDSVSIPIPSSSVAVPSGWVVRNATGAAGWPPGYGWQDLMRNVDGIEISGSILSATPGSSAWVDNIELVHAPGFHLYAPELNAAGSSSTLTALNGTRGGLVGFAASLAPGASTVHCAGAVLGTGLSAPRLLGVVPTDGYGHAHLAGTPPTGLAGVSVHVQALDLMSCTLSNVLTVTLP